MKNASSLIRAFISALVSVILPMPGLKRMKALPLYLRSHSRVK
jgi:hypothetical protein